MTDPTRRAVLLTATAFALGGCAVARGAPQRREVLAGAGDEASFAVQEVTRDTLPKIRQWPVLDPRAPQNWPGRGAGPTSQRIAPGDTVSLRIWSAEESSLITSPGAKFTDMPGLVVSQSGHLALPYIDAVHVAGLTPASARKRLEERLTEIIASAQVQLTTETGRKNTVDMVAGVRTPGPYPMKARNLTLLNLVSAAGGVVESLPNPQATITRGGTVYRIPFAKVLERPALDATLRGGDRVAIVPDARSFKVIGAAQGQSVIPFDTETLSALRAVSMMGGLSDATADPKGLLLLRRYPDKAVGGDHGPPRAHMVFSFDLTSAGGLFAADAFLLQDGDVLVATQAAGTTTQRALGLFGSVLGAGRAASNF